MQRIDTIIKLNKLKMFELKQYPAGLVTHAFPYAPKISNPLF